MITEQKLQTALAKIARWQAVHAHGRPMSGLSIPAKYYFEKKADHKARRLLTQSVPTRQVIEWGSFHKVLIFVFGF
jgi:hypothetical protein